MPTSSAGDPSSARERNFGLDLMRAIAIMLVMVSHWCNNISYWFGIQMPHQVFFSGDLGVEVFFLLSGFLIGRILIDIIHREPTWRSLRVFLVRRWMRTLPLYFVWLAVQSIYWPPTHHPARTIIHFATLTQNLFQHMPEDYWFAVSWSLTIEEWFYLIFGFAVIATAIRFGPRLAIWLPLTLFLSVPLILRLSVPDFVNPSWTVGLQHEVFFRLDEIAYGVVMAELWRRRHWLFRYPLLLLVEGVLLIAWLWSYGLPLPPRYAIALSYNVTMIGCALCLPAALCLRHATGRVAGVVRMISLQSYGLYLMHLTILVDLAQGLWGRQTISNVAAVPIAVGLPFVLSWLSYRVLEAPILARRPAQFLSDRPSSASVA